MEFKAVDRSRWLTLPNLLSAYRIVIAPVIAVLIATGHRTPFAVLIVVNLVTDILDGLIARAWHQETEFGAKLDSWADRGTYLLAILGFLVFERPFLSTHRFIAGLLVGCYFMSIGVSLLRFHRLPTLHLYSAKATGYAQGIFFGLYFLVGYLPAVFAAMVVVSLVNTVEEIAVLLVLRTPRSNARGLYWVLTVPDRGR